MPQMLLPIFPDGLTHINNRIGFQKKDHNVYYFNGMMPIFFHHEDDMNSFRFITAQIAVLGNATQAEIVRAFGISTISMKRYVKRYRDRGPAGFFDKPRRRGAGVLTKGFYGLTSIFLLIAFLSLHVSRALMVFVTVLLVILANCLVWIECLRFEPCVRNWSILAAMAMSLDGTLSCPVTGWLETLM